MISFTDLEYLFRSGFLILFSGFLLILEMKYMLLELLMLRFVIDSCFVITGSMYYMLLLLRFSDDLWKQYTEPVRFSIYD